MNEIMPLSLKVILSLSIVLFLGYVFKNIKDKKVSIKHALIWIIMGVVAIICIFQIENLSHLADLLGVKTTSNLIFFLGFIFLLFVAFSLTRTSAAHSEKIRKLTQELALLKQKEKKKHHGSK